MLVLRLLAVLLVIGIGAALVAYLWSGNPRYRQLAWRLARFGIVLLLVFLSLLALERVLVPLL